MTTAERIAAQFGNDGTCFELADGCSLGLRCRTEGATKRTSNGDTAWEFTDGSAIVESHGAAWDVRHPECTCGFCWSGAGAHCEEVTR